MAGPAAAFLDSVEWSGDGWRPLSVGRSERPLIWCGQFQERAEAVERLRALWEAWEAARAEGGNAMSYWWTVHVDAHWAALTDSATGPFSAYRARLVEIAAELDKADLAGDRERSAGLAAEQEALIAELRGAYGLGGHPRRPGASAERARTAVRSRIRDALQRIEVAHRRSVATSPIPSGPVATASTSPTRLSDRRGGAAHCVTRSHA